MTLLSDVNDIDVRCVLTPILPFHATEKYQNTSVLGREYLNMWRAKKAAASESQVPAQQEAAVNPFPIKQIRELLIEMKDETIKEMKEDIKKLSDRIQALELK